MERAAASIPAGLRHLPSIQSNARHTEFRPGAGDLLRHQVELRWYVEEEGVGAWGIGVGCNTSFISPSGIYSSLTGPWPPAPDPFFFSMPGEFHLMTW